MVVGFSRLTKGLTSVAVVTFLPEVVSVMVVVVVIILARSLGVMDRLVVDMGHYMAQDFMRRG